MLRHTLVAAALSLLAPVAYAAPPESPTTDEITRGNDAAEDVEDVEDDAEEESTFDFGIGVQLRFVAESDLQGEGDVTFAVWRVRPSLNASLLEGRLRMRLFLDVAPRAVELLDAFVELDLGSQTVRVGAGKLPFTSHWTQSYLDLGFVDWPLTTRWFGGGRQLGVSVRNSSESTLSYELGLYTGQTLRAANGSRFTKMYGGTPANYLSLRERTALGQPHPELAGRLTLQDERDSVTLSASWDMRPTYQVDESLRVALDGWMTRGPFQFGAGAYLSVSQGEHDQWLAALGGALAEVRARTSSGVSVGLRFAAVVQSAALKSDALEHVALLEQGTTIQPDELAELQERVAATGSLYEATLALEVPVWSERLRWVSDVSWLYAARTSAHMLRVRSQLQAAF